MKLKKLLSGLFSVFVIVVIAVVAYFHQPYINHQVDKVKGMYYVHLGDKAYRVYNIKDAILFYNKGLNLYPKHYGAWHNLGNIYVAYEDYSAALDAYSHAFRINPKMMIARMNYGIVASELLGDFDSAIDQYKKTIKTKRYLIDIPFIFNNKLSYYENKAIAYYNMGVTYRMKSLYATDNWEKQRKYINLAIQNYQKSIDIFPDSYDAQYNLGTLYHITGDYDRAGRCYCKAISLEPTKYEAHYNLAVLLKRLGHYNEAYEEIDKAVTLIPALDQNSALLEYIASVMNDISRNVYNNEEYKRYVKYRETLIAQKKIKEIKKENEKKAKKSKKMHRDYGEPISDGPVFVDKKEVTEEELDEAIHSDFGSCPSYHYFDPSREEF